MIVEAFRDDSRIFSRTIEENPDYDTHSWLLDKATNAMAREGKAVEVGDLLVLEDGSRYLYGADGTFQEQ